MPFRRSRRPRKPNHSESSPHPSSKKLSAADVHARRHGHQQHRFQQPRTPTCCALFVSGTPRVSVRRASSLPLHVPSRTARFGGRCRRRTVRLPAAPRPSPRLTPVRSPPLLRSLSLSLGPAPLRSTYSATHPLHLPHPTPPHHTRRPQAGRPARAHCTALRTHTFLPFPFPSPLVPHTAHRAPLPLPASIPTPCRRTRS